MKKVIAIILFMVTCIITTGSYSESDIQLNIVETIKNADGTNIYYYDNGTYYEGEIDTRLRKNGQGALYLDDRIIVGRFVSDTIKTGAIIYDNGDVYEGDITKYMAHGKGEKRFKNGDKYIGSFKLDTLDGEGSLMMVTKETYKGEFKYGVYHGKGRYTKDGILTQGEFKFGKYIKYLPSSDFN